MVNKKVILNLVGKDGNAYAIMGIFKQAAKEQGWTKEEIDEVLQETITGDYYYLLGTIAGYCEKPTDFEV